MENDNGFVTETEINHLKISLELQLKSVTKSVFVSAFQNRVE